MLIFIDTEFTDFKSAELISLGLVTEDCRHEFYAELPINQARCSDFVLRNVLLQLRKVPDPAGALQHWVLRLALAIHETLVIRRTSKAYGESVT